VANLDWIFLAVMAFSAVVGVVRGLITEVFSLLSWLVAFALAHRLAPQVAPLVPMGGASENLRYAAGFVAVFVGALMAGALVIFLINKAMAVAGLRPIDRVLGGAFGAGRGTVLLLVVTVVVGLTPLRQSSWWLEAHGPRLAEAALAGLKPLLPDGFAKFFP